MKEELVTKMEVRRMKKKEEREAHKMQTIYAEREQEPTRKQRQHLEEISGVGDRKDTHQPSFFLLYSLGDSYCFSVADRVIDFSLSSGKLVFESKPAQVMTQS